jgi:hypothetical protein
MNYFLIITIAIIIILLYILWKYFSNSGTNLVKNTNLNTIQSTPIPINNTSVQYAYGIWVYVNSWNQDTTSGVKKTIFSRSNNSSMWDTSGNYTTCLYLDPVSPTLYLDIAQTGTSQKNPIIISTNFPIQKWCYVAFSVNNQYVDCYLDGKLVKSVYLQNTITTPALKDAVYVGSPRSVNDIYVNSFYHWANPLTPQQVWSNYLNGNGTSPMAALTNSFGFGFAFYKNNVETSTYRLF